MADHQFSEIWKILRDHQFELENDINKEFICAICKKILINACNGPCGCRYCLECISGYLNGDEKFCPADMDECMNEMINIDRNIHLENAIDIRISRMELECPEISCEYKGQLKKIGDHMRVCKEKATACPYCTIGCKDMKVLPGKMDNHLLLEIQSHSILLIESMNHLTNEIESMKKDVANLKIENISLKENGEINKSVISELRAHLETLEQNWQQSELRLGDFERAEETNRTDFSARINEISQKYDVAMKNVKKSINDLKNKNDELEANENKYSGGEFLWNIERLSDKVNNNLIKINRVTYSDPFYSHKNGYQMCFRLDPVTLSLCLMQGLFDNNLQWPFNHDVTIDIIDPQKGIPKQSETIKFVDCPNDVPWNKPIKIKAEPIQIWFMCTEELCRIASDLIDDRISIKCTVNIKST